MLLVDGMAFLLEGIDSFQIEHGADWRDKFVDFYFDERIAVDLNEACALSTLTADVTRADDETRLTYETVLDVIVNKIAKGLGRQMSCDQVWVFLAILSGAADMARAAPDLRLRAQILSAAAKVAKAI